MVSFTGLPWGATKRAPTLLSASNAGGPTSRQSRSGRVQRTSAARSNEARKKGRKAMLEKQIRFKLEHGYELLTFMRCPQCKGHLIRKKHVDAREEAKEDNERNASERPASFARTPTEKGPLPAVSASDDSGVSENVFKSSPPLTARSLLRNICFSSTALGYQGEDDAGYCGFLFCGAHGGTEGSPTNSFESGRGKKNPADDFDCSPKDARSDESGKQDKESIEDIREVLPYCISCRAHVITEHVSLEQQDALQMLVERWSAENEAVDGRVIRGAGEVSTRSNWTRIKGTNKHADAVKERTGNHGSILVTLDTHNSSNVTDCLQSGSKSLQTSKSSAKDAFGEQRFTNRVVKNEVVTESIHRPYFESTAHVALFQHEPVFPLPRGTKYEVVTDEISIESRANDIMGRSRTKRNELKSSIDAPETRFELLKEENNANEACLGGPAKAFAEGDVERPLEDHVEGHVDRPSEDHVKGHVERPLEDHVKGHVERHGEGDVEGDAEGDAEVDAEQPLEGHVERHVEGTLEGHVNSQEKKQDDDEKDYEHDCEQSKTEQECQKDGKEYGQQDVEDSWMKGCDSAATLHQIKLRSMSTQMRHVFAENPVNRNESEREEKGIKAGLSNEKTAKTNYKCFEIAPRQRDSKPLPSLSTYTSSPGETNKVTDSFVSFINVTHEGHNRGEYSRSLPKFEKTNLPPNIIGRAESLNPSLGQSMNRDKEEVDHPITHTSFEDRVAQKIGEEEYVFEKANSYDDSRSSSTDHSDRNSNSSLLECMSTMTKEEYMSLNHANKREIGARVIGDKLVQGYKLTQTPCANCELPLMSIDGTLCCVTCPEFVRTAKERAKKKSKRTNRRRHECWAMEERATENDTHSDENRDYPPLLAIPSPYPNSTYANFPQQISDFSIYQKEHVAQYFQPGREHIDLKDYPEWKVRTTAGGSSHSPEPKKESERLEVLLVDERAKLYDDKRDRQRLDGNLCDKVPEETPHPNYFQPLQEHMRTKEANGCKTDVTEESGEIKDDWWSIALKNENAIFDNFFSSDERKVSGRDASHFFQRAGYGSAQYCCEREEVRNGELKNMVAAPGFSESEPLKRDVPNNFHPGKGERKNAERSRKHRREKDCSSSQDLLPARSSGRKMKTTRLSMNGSSRLDSGPGFSVGVTPAFRAQNRFSEPFVIPMESIVPLPIATHSATDHSLVVPEKESENKIFSRKGRADLYDDSSLHKWKHAKGEDYLRTQTLRGWTILSQSCRGEKCGSVPLRSFRGGPPVCFLCGQTGSRAGFDEMRRHQVRLSHGRKELNTFLPESSYTGKESAIKGGASRHDDGLNFHSTPAETQEGSGYDLGESRETNDVDRRRRYACKEISRRLQLDWVFSNSYCPKCIMPLLQKSGAHPQCVICDPMCEGAAVKEQTTRKKNSLETDKEGKEPILPHYQQRRKDVSDEFHKERKPERQEENGALA